MGIKKIYNTGCLSLIKNIPDKIYSTHPTMKLINLLTKVLSLFKTPNPQLVLDTFAGSGSIGIACEKLGIDYILIEQNKEYCDIEELRIRYWG